MAIGDYLPVVVPSSATATLSASTSSSIKGRKGLIQVATHNSATFIPFPTNARRASFYMPKYRPRTSRSITRPVLSSIDTQSTSNKSKSSKTPSLSMDSARFERRHSENRPNPILNNSLLNHRKQQPSFHPVNISADCSYTTRFCLSTKPLKSVSDDNQVLVRENNITSVVGIQKLESNVTTDDDDDDDSDDDDDNDYQQELYGLNKTKYDYITNWIYDVEQATSSTETFSSTKYSKKRLIQS